MKSFYTAVLLTVALLASPVARAASYQDRTIATGAVIGATTGAVVGSSRNQAVEGAIFGAVLGTIAGVVIASQSQPTYVVQHQPRPHYRPVRHEYERKHAYSRPSNRQHDRYATTRGYEHDHHGRH